MPRIYAPSAIYRPESYPGFYGDGVNDDSPAWLSLMADLFANTQNGVVQPGIITLGAYTTLVRPGIIGPLPQGSAIIGYGPGASCIMWWHEPNQPTQPGPFLVDLSGTIDGSSGEVALNGYHLLQDLTLDGGASGGGAYLLRLYYNAHSRFIGLRGNSAAYGLIDAVQLWDARFYDLQGETCGSSSSSNSFWIRNSATPTKYEFGYSKDGSNQIFIIGARFESQYGCSLRIERGGDSVYPPNGIYVTNWKTETGFSTTAPLFYVGSGTTVCSFRDIYVAVDTNSNVSPPINMIEDHSTYGVNWGPVYLTGSLNSDGSSLVANAFLSAASGATTIGQVQYSGNSGARPTSGAVVTVTGTVKPTIVGNISSDPLVAATVGMNIPLTGAATINPTDKSVLVDLSSGSFSVAVPSSSLCINPLTITRTDTSSNVLTLTSTDETGIEGLGNIAIPDGRASVTLVPMDIGWLISGTYQFSLPGPLVVVDDSAAQLVLEGETDHRQQLLVGYDTTNDWGTIQALKQGIDYMMLWISMKGGKVGMGTLPAATSQTDAAGKGVQQNQLFTISGAVQQKS